MTMMTTCNSERGDRRRHKYTQALLAQKTTDTGEREREREIDRETEKEEGGEILAGKQQ